MDPNKATVQESSLSNPGAWELLRDALSLSSHRSAPHSLLCLQLAAHDREEGRRRKRKQMIGKQLLLGVRRGSSFFGCLADLPSQNTRHSSKQIQLPFAPEGQIICEALSWISTERAEHS